MRCHHFCLNVADTGQYHVPKALSIRYFHRHNLLKNRVITTFEGCEKALLLGSLAAIHRFNSTITDFIFACRVRTDFSITPPRAGEPEGKAGLKISTGSRALDLQWIPGCRPKVGTASPQLPLQKLLLVWKMLAL